MKSKNKRLRDWIRIRREVLIPLFHKKGHFGTDGMAECEIKIDKACRGKSFTGFCHRHERSWYYREDRVHLLGDYTHNQVGCSICHFRMDSNKKLREQIFMKNRGAEQA